MDTHKRILGILFIISGSIQILLMLFINAIISTLLPIAFENSDHDQRVLAWILPFISVLSVTIILLMGLPSIIGGAGLLARKKWALMLILILGCIKLFSFPVGTALGIYTIWVYTEDNRRASTPAQ